MTDLVSQLAEVPVGWVDQGLTTFLEHRFADESAAPQLHWILLHLIQEYARHAGHLDIARELIDGVTGEEP